MNHVLSSIIGIAKDNKISKVILFGSRARGDYTESSDYDIAFISAESPYEIRSKILDAVDELDTLYKIDIVFLQDLQGEDDLTQNIVREGVVLMDKFQYKLQNFERALLRLKESIADFDKMKNMSVRDGAIQRFEFTTELSWKTMREYLLSENVIDINSPKSVLRAAFDMKLIVDEEGWRSILNDRNQTSHLYDEDNANQIFQRICEQHVALFDEVIVKLKRI